MNTFIEKDPAIKAMIKERAALENKKRVLQKKMLKKVEKLISTRILAAISSHKWFIYDDPYSESSLDKARYSLCFSIYDEEKDVCSQIKLPGIPALNKRPRSLSSSNSKASKYKKSMIYPSLKINYEIKNWRDLSRVCEHWDIQLIKWKDVFISIQDRSFRVISNDGIDAVFYAAKKLDIALNMKHSFSQIEEIECFLEKKKKLMSELSSKMLFSV